MRAKRFRRKLMLLPIASILAACSTTSSAKQPVKESQIDPTTTVPVDAPSPWVALENLAKKRHAVDFSRLSIGHQGIYAIVIVNKRTWNIGDAILFQWDGKNWNDVNARISDPILFENADKIPAQRVTTYDFNQDGVNDFLISYFDPDQMMRPMGGVLTIAKNNEWWWLQFDMTDGSMERMVDALTYDPKTQLFYGEDFIEGRTTVSWKWNPETTGFQNLGAS